MEILDIVNTKYQKIHNDYNELSDIQKNQLLEWILLNFSPIRYLNMKHKSSDLKNYFEKSENGFEISNNQFKYAMLLVGFKIDSIENDEWKFNISEASKCLQGGD